MKTFTFTVSMLVIPAVFLYAQDSTLNEQNQEAISKSSTGTPFLLTGYGFTGFEMTGSKEANFGETGFSPIFLWKPSDKLFFEGELEIELSGSKSEFMLEYADLNYIVHKYITFRAGLFLSPFGTFSERLHPAWINKFASKPLGFGHSGVGPGSEAGIELRGGVPLWHSKMNYSVYLSNGPKLNTSGNHGGAEPEIEAGSGPEESGSLEYNNYIDNNLNKAVGGRIGLLPFTNSSCEVGFSFQQAKAGQDKVKGYAVKTVMDTVTMVEIQEMNYGNVGAQMWAVDFSYTQSVPFLMGILDIKGQLNNIAVDDASYYMDVDSAFYTFDNTSQAYYAQLAYRPALLKNKFLKNIELLGRYSNLIMAKDAEWGQEETQTAFGINYWLGWRSVFKFQYQISDVRENTFLFQFATGF